MANKVWDIITQAIETMSGDKSDETQNWYNDSDDAKISTDVYGEEIKKQEPRYEKPAYIYPVKIQSVTSPYGWRKLWKGAKRSWHNGVDFTGRNKECYAVCRGTVTEVRLPDAEYSVLFKYDPQAGEFVRDRNVPEGRAWTPYIYYQSEWDENIQFGYKHIRPHVEVGQILEVGDVIGDVENLGYSMGAHLHWEVWYKKPNGKWITLDPIPWLKKMVNKGLK